MEEPIVSIPDKMKAFLETHPLSMEEKNIQLALMLYPYIANETISFGFTADLIGMHRIDFIELYGKIGIPFFSMTKEEMEDEIRMAKEPWKE